MKTFLLNILNRIFPPEQPSQSELLSYLREQMRQERQHVYLLEHLCPEHGIALQEVRPGEWKCPTPHRIPAVTPQQTQQPASPVQVHVDYALRQQALHAQLEERRIQNRQQEQSIRKTILMDVPPEVLNQERQQISEATFIEDQWLLNSTPVELPTIDEQEGETETGLPAFAAYLKHVSKRTA